MSLWSLKNEEGNMDVDLIQQVQISDHHTNFQAVSHDTFNAPMFGMVV